MTLNSILKTMYGLLKPLVQTILQNSISAIQVKMMPEDYSKKCSLPNSHFDKNLAWLQSEVCHFLKWLTTDLTWGLAKQGGRRLILVIPWKSSTPDRASVFHSTWLHIKCWFQCCKSTYSWITGTIWQYQRLLFPVCAEDIRNYTFIWRSTVCYLTWCRVLAETKTLGRDMGLVWVLKTLETTRQGHDCTHE